MLLEYLLLRLPILVFKDAFKAFSEYFFGVIPDAMNSFTQGLVDVPLEIFILLRNPVDSQSALIAWNSMFEVALALLPIMMILGLLSMPFADEQKTSLWRQGIRVVGVIAIIAVSKPLIGFGVELSNALTVATLPNGDDIFAQILGGGILNGGSTLFETGAAAVLVVAVAAALFYFGYGIYFVIMFALIVIMLQLRQFFIYTVFIASPLLAVFWYADWGMLEPVNEFANKWFRMGLYTCLTGPIVGIIFHVIVVIGTGGVIDGADGVGELIGSLWSTLVIITIAPILLIAVIWKIVAWAGEPVGAGQAMSGVAIAATAGIGKMAEEASGKLGDAMSDQDGNVNTPDGSDMNMGGGSGDDYSSSSSTGGGGGAGNAGAGGNLQNEMQEIRSDSGSAVEQSADDNMATADASAAGAGTADASGSGPDNSSEGTAQPTGTANDVEGKSTQGGVDNHKTEGTGGTPDGPSDDITGASDPEGPQPTKGYMQSGYEKYKGMKSSAGGFLADQKQKAAKGITDNINPTFMEDEQRRQAEEKADSIAETGESFSEAYSFNKDGDGKGGMINLDQVEGDFDDFADGEEVQTIDSQGNFEYETENGGTKEANVFEQEGKYNDRENVQRNIAQGKAEKAEQVQEKWQKRAEKAKKTKENLSDIGKAGAGAFAKGAIRGTVGSQAPHLMGGPNSNSGIGSQEGAHGSGSSSGQQTAASRGTGRDQGGDVNRQAETAITTDEAAEHGDTVRESGERFDMASEGGFTPDPEGNTEEGVAQSGTFEDPETGEEVPIQVGEDADFRLDKNETARPGNLRMEQNRDGENTLVADENSRLYGENEVRGQEFVGNPDMEGQDVAMGGTLQQDPNDPEGDAAGLFRIETDNGYSNPIRAEDEEMAEHLQENVGQNVVVNGEAVRQYGMDPDAHAGYEGGHEYNAISMSSKDTDPVAFAGMAGASINGNGGGGPPNGGDPNDEGLDLVAEENGTSYERDYGIPTEEIPEGANLNTIAQDLESRKNPYSEFEDLPESRQEKLKSKDHWENRDTSEVVEGHNIPENDQMREGITQEQVSTAIRDHDEIDSYEDIPNSQKNSIRGEEIHDTAPGKDDNRVNAFSNSEGELGPQQDNIDVDESPREAPEASPDGLSPDSPGNGGVEPDGDAPVPDSVIKEGESTSKSGHGVTPITDNNASPGTDDGVVVGTQEIETQGPQDKEDDSYGGDSSSSSDEDDYVDPGETQTVDAEEITQADSTEDAPFNVAPEGNFIFEDTMDGVADDDEKIGARGIFYETNENGEKKEDGEHFGYVRFTNEHEMGADAKPEFDDGERRDPEDGEVVGFNGNNGMGTRMWSTANNHGDPFINAEEHGGNGETPARGFGMEDQETVPEETEYNQVFPHSEDDEGGISKMHSRGKKDRPENLSPAEKDTIHERGNGIEDVEDLEESDIGNTEDYWEEEYGIPEDDLHQNTDASEVADQIRETDGVESWEDTEQGDAIRTNALTGESVDYEDDLGIPVDDLADDQEPHEVANTIKDRGNNHWKHLGDDTKDSMLGKSGSSGTLTASKQEIEEDYADKDPYEESPDGGTIEFEGKLADKPHSEQAGHASKGLANGIGASGQEHYNKSKDEVEVDTLARSNEGGDDFIGTGNLDVQDQTSDGRFTSETEDGEQVLDLGIDSEEGQMTRISGAEYSHEGGSTGLKLTDDTEVQEVDSEQAAFRYGDNVEGTSFTGPEDFEDSDIKEDRLKEGFDGAETFEGEDGTAAEILESSDSLEEAPDEVVEHAAEHPEPINRDDIDSDTAIRYINDNSVPDNFEELKESGIDDEHYRDTNEEEKYLNDETEVDDDIGNNTTVGEFLNDNEWDEHDDTVYDEVAEHPGIHKDDNVITDNAHTYLSPDDNGLESLEDLDKEAEDANTPITKDDYRRNPKYNEDNHDGNDGDGHDGDGHDGDSHNGDDHDGDSHNEDGHDEESSKDTGGESGKDTNENTTDSSSSKEEIQQKFEDVSNDLEDRPDGEAEAHQVPPQDVINEGGDNAEVVDIDPDSGDSRHIPDNPDEKLGSGEDTSETGSPDIDTGDDTVEQDDDPEEDDDDDDDDDDDSSDDEGPDSGN